MVERLVVSMASMVKIPKSIDGPMVRAFLESRAKKSVKTARTYGCALESFRKFIAPKGYSMETIVGALKREELDIYRLFDQYVQQLPNTGQTPLVWVSGIRKYLAYHDIYVIDEKFKNRVTLPIPRQEEIPPVGRDEIRRILLGISNQRFRTFCICKAAAGFRAVEGLAIQMRDLTFFDEYCKST